MDVSSLSKSLPGCNWLRRRGISFTHTRIVTVTSLIIYRSHGLFVRNNLLLSNKGYTLNELGICFCVFADCSLKFLFINFRWSQRKPINGTDMLNDIVIRSFFCLLISFLELDSCPLSCIPSLALFVEFLGYDFMWFIRFLVLTYMEPR